MKKFIIAIILLAGVQGQANAQFLKKLGNAIEKASKTIDDVANAVLGDTNSTSNTTQSKKKDKEKRVGRPVQIGNATIECYGEETGLEFNLVSVERRYSGSMVRVAFQLTNPTSQEINVEMSCSRGAYLLDQSGRKYSCLYFNLNGFTGQDNGSVTIAEGTKVLCQLYFDDVPSDVTDFQLIYLGMLIRPGFKDCSFRVKNAPLTLLPAITSKGIFGASRIRLGDRIATLPKTFEGLYDSFNVEEVADEESDFVKTVTFFLKGEEVFTAFSYDGTTIEYITLTTPLVAAKVHNKFYRCGENVSGQTYKGGFSRDDYGTLIYNGIMFDEDVDNKVCTIRIGEQPFD